MIPIHLLANIANRPLGEDPALSLLPADTVPGVLDQVTQVENPVAEFVRQGEVTGLARPASLLDQALDAWVQPGFPRLPKRQDPVEPVHGRQNRRAVAVMHPAGGQGRIDLAHPVEDGRQGLGGVEVLVHGLLELLQNRLAAGLEFGAGAPRQRLGFDPAPEVLQPLERGPGLPYGVRREVELALVRNALQGVTNGPGLNPLLQQVPKGMEIALGLGHLLAIHDEMLPVDPVAHEGLGGGGLALSNLVLVVGKDEVHRAAMQVEGLAQVLHAHGGTLDVPSRTTGTQRGLPSRFPVPGSLPQDEVPRILLVVFVHVHAGPSPNSLPVQLGQLPVVPEGLDPEIDRSVLLVGVASGLKLPDQGHHVIDVIGRVNGSVGFLDAQPIAVLEKGPGKAVRKGSELSDGLRFGVPDGLVVNVGDVHDVKDPKALVPQIALQNVLEDEGSEVSDVDKVIHRRTAGVHFDLPGLQRFKGFDSPGEGVGQPQHE